MGVAAAGISSLALPPAAAAASDGIPVAVAPTAPTITSAVPAGYLLTTGADGNGAIDVTWSSVGTATTYVISTRTPSGTGTYSVAGTTSGTTFRVLGLAEAATYDVVVAASNGAGTSGDSTPVTAVGTVVATGGTVTSYTSGTTRYVVHTFTHDGLAAERTDHTLTVAVPRTMDALVVGGGGGGGGAAGGHNCGGGGGGQVVSRTGGQAIAVAVGSVPVAVGRGGAPGGTATLAETVGGVGVSSRLLSGADLVEAAGGGGGAGGSGNPGGGVANSDASAGGFHGGGGSSQASADVLGSPGTRTAPAYSGGAAFGSSGSLEAQGGGGGGGAGEAGGDASSGVAGAGGDGAISSIATGVDVRYGGGGGGGSRAGTLGPGGSGGGGAGGRNATGSDGSPHTGGGGGGAASMGTSAAGGAGGSGVVIVRYVL